MDTITASRQQLGMGVRLVALATIIVGLIAVALMARVVDGIHGASPAPQWRDVSVASVAPEVCEGDGAVQRVQRDGIEFYVTCSNGQHAYLTTADSTDIRQ